MPELKIISGTIVDGADVRPGTVVNVDRAMARALLINNKAVPYAGEPATPTTKEVKTKPKQTRRKK